MRRKSVHGISAPCSGARGTNGFVNRRSSVQSRALAQSSEKAEIKEKDPVTRATSPQRLCGTKTLPFGRRSGKLRPLFLAVIAPAVGLSFAQAVQVLAVCDRIRRHLPKVVSKAAKERQRCYVAQRLHREFDRLGIGTVGVAQ